jgi:hypothetical protein
MMIFAQTPSAASNVYKQLGMQGVENLDIWYRCVAERNCLLKT